MNKFPISFRKILDKYFEFSFVWEIKKHTLKYVVTRNLRIFSHALLVGKRLQTPFFLPIFHKKKYVFTFFSWNHLVILTLNELQYQSKLLLQEIPWRPKVHLPPRNCRTFQQCWDSDSHAWWQPGTNDKNDGNELFFSVKRFVVSNPWTMGGFPVIFSRRKNDRGIVYKQQCLFCFICNIHRGCGTLWGG